MLNVSGGLLGMSLAAIIRGLRFGVKEFRVACASTSSRIDPFEAPEYHIIRPESLDLIVGKDGVEIRLSVKAYEDGMLPVNDALALLSIAAMVRPPVVLEIGTFTGHTTKSLALNLPEAIIHTLDLPLDFSAGSDPVTNVAKDDFHLIRKRAPGREFLGTPFAGRIRQHFGDSANWDFQQAAGANFFFIDGSHTYDYCKLDSERCFDLCGGKGVFLWHDCDPDHPGVYRALSEWKKKGRDVVRINGTHLGYWNSLD